MSLAERSQIVEIGPEHVGPLTALFERNRATAVAETFDPFPLSGEQAAEIALAPRNDRYLAAVLGDAFVAMSMLRGFDEGYDVPSFGIFVDIAWQGKGIGRWLTETTIEAASKQGCPAIRLSVYASNPGAVHLYRALGFEESECRPIKRRSGLDEKIVMYLRLER